MRSANKLVKTVKSLVPYVLLVGLVYVAYTMYVKPSEGFAAAKMDVSGDLHSALAWMSYPLVSAAVGTLNTLEQSLGKANQDVAKYGGPMSSLVLAWRTVRNTTDKAVKNAPGYHASVVAAQKAMDDYSKNIYVPAQQVVTDLNKKIAKADGDLQTAINAAILAKRKADTLADRTKADNDIEASTPRPTSAMYNNTMKSYKGKATGTHNGAGYWSMAKNARATTPEDLYGYFMALADSSPVESDGKSHSRSFFLLIASYLIKKDVSGHWLYVNPSADDLKKIAKM